MKCPVASCDEEIKVNSNRWGYRHFQDYDEFHKTLHYNWLNYFYKDLADSDYTDELKFRIAYRRYVQEQKNLKKQKHSEPESFTVNNGKVNYQGKEYILEEFQRLFSKQPVPVGIDRKEYEKQKLIEKLER
jgi:nitric oxide reductase large subunit